MKILTRAQSDGDLAHDCGGNIDPYQLEYFHRYVLKQRHMFMPKGKLLTTISITTTDNTRVLLPASIEAPLTIIITCLPALKLLRPGSGGSHAPRKRHPQATPFGAALGSSGPATPTTNPFSGFRPPRPARPSSTRSFMTEGSSRTQQKPAEGQLISPGVATSFGATTVVAANKPTTPVEDLLPDIEYDFKRWNQSNNSSPANPTFPRNAAPSPARIGAMNTSTNNYNYNNNNGNNNNNSMRPGTGRSHTSNNSTTGLLAARDYLSSSPSPPSSPSSPVPSTGHGGLFPRPAPAATRTMLTGPGTDHNDTTHTFALNMSSNNNNNLMPGPMDNNNRRLTIVKEESTNPSWSSSVARSSIDRASSLLDLYTNGSTGGLKRANTNPRGGTAPANNTQHVPMKSRDSPTLGDWSGWSAAAGAWRGEAKEDVMAAEMAGNARGHNNNSNNGSLMVPSWQQQGQQQQQQQRRFPVSPGVRPLHARQRLPPETGPTASAGWTQRMLGI